MIEIALVYNVDCEQIRNNKLFVQIALRFQASPAASINTIWNFMPSEA